MSDKADSLKIRKWFRMHQLSEVKQFLSVIDIEGVTVKNNKSGSSKKQLFSRGRPFFYNNIFCSSVFISEIA